MKKFKLLPIFLVASTLALSSCNLFGSKSSGKKKKKSSSSDITSVTSDTSGSGSGSSSSSEGPEVVTLQSIALSNIQSIYNVGDSFVKPTVVATYSDSSTKTVTEQTTFSGYNLSTAGTQTVTASYTDGVTKTASYTITVRATDWTADQKTIMTTDLDGVILPWIAGTWDVQDYGGQVYCLANDVSTSDATAVFDADNGWTYAGVDSYGDPLYTKPTQSEGTVTANIYENSYYTCVINAWFTEKQERTTDTEWNQEVKEIMHHVLGNQEELPFMAFGSKYGIVDYNDFGFEFYDEYAEDLTAEYLEVLATSDWTYLRDDDYGDPVYGKSFGDGTSAEINIYFYEDYGNCIDATFIPVKTESATWPSFDELTEIETTSGYTVPQFSSTSYQWYTRYGVAYIEGTASENLVAAYGAHVDELGIINKVSTYSGSATNWEETFELTYSALGYEEEQDEETVVVYTGFLVSATITEPTSEFLENGWDDDLVTEYLDMFEVENPGVKAYTTTTGKQLKWTFALYEEVLAEYLETYAEYIEAGYIDEETVAGWAYAESGLFIMGYDPEGADLATYNAAYASDTSWEHEQQTEGDVVYDYYTKDGVTVCVYANNKATIIQIMEPSPQPVPPTPGEPVTVSTTIEAYASANSWVNATKYSTVVLDEVITATASDGTNNSKYYSSDNSWRFYETESGTLTISAASGYTIQSITLTFTIKDSGTLSYGGTAVTSKTAVEINASSAVFAVGGGGKGKVFITAISVTYVAE